MIPDSGSFKNEWVPYLDKASEIVICFDGDEAGNLGAKKLADRLGKPDFAVHDDLLPIGYIELKAPGKGANPGRYKGHDREQWKRFKNVPNIEITTGIIYSITAIILAISGVGIWSLMIAYILNILYQNIKNFYQVLLSRQQCRWQCFHNQ